jgi:ankyrin repeat protein
MKKVNHIPNLDHQTLCTILAFDSVEYLKRVEKKYKLSWKDIEDSEKRSLLAVSLSNAKHHDVFPYLFENINPTDIEQINGAGCSLLVVAARYGNIPAVRMLVQKGANIYAKTSDKENTALDLIARYNKVLAANIKAIADQIQQERSTQSQAEFSDTTDAQKKPSFNQKYAIASRTSDSVSASLRKRHPIFGDSATENSELLKPLLKKSSDILTRK